MKYCEKCQQNKPDEAFVIKRRTPDITYPVCIECCGMKQIDLPFRVRLSRQVYESNAKARWFKVIMDFRPDDWQEILEASQGFCAYCREYIGIDKLTIEHVIPVSKGGPHRKDNIVATCWKCNQTKAARLPKKS